MHFKTAVLGGTFDRLHKGHEKLIATAFSQADFVYIGVTTDEFVGQFKQPQKLPSIVLSREKRIAELADFLRSKGWLHRVEIMPLKDIFGNTLERNDLDAIVVSPETELAATEINLKRAQNNLPALEVICVPWVMAKDGKPINSFRIRRGEIDRCGNLFTFSRDWGVRRLPNNLRETLGRPIGTLIKDSQPIGDAVLSFLNNYLEYDRISPKEIRKKRLVVGVGDAVVKQMVDHGYQPDVAIVDLHIQRQRVHTHFKQLGFKPKYEYKATNQAGTLSFAAITVVEKIIRQSLFPAVVEIDGEDDLLTLAALFVAPLGAFIVYGQPNEGLVVVEVNEQIKKNVRQWLAAFTH